MITRLRYPKGYQFFDGNGMPIALGQLFYYQAGTTSAQDTYSDSGGTVTNTNPIVLDASGRLQVDVYLGSAADYKEILTFSGATVSPWPDDNILRAGQADWNATSGPSLILNKPALAAVATSGSYTDLSNTPSTSAVFAGDSGAGGTSGLVPAPAAGTAVANKFLKADGTWAVPPGGSGSGSTNLTVTEAGNSVAIASSSGSGATIPAATSTAAGVLDSTRAAKIDGLATVASSGSYNDLSNKPTIPAAQVNSDWNAPSGAAQILNKPAIPAAPTNMSGATASAAGSAGLVPAPSAGQQSSFLRGDGTWAWASGGGTNISITQASSQVTVNSSTGTGGNIPPADTSNAGVMTAADRTTLNSLGTAATQNVPSSGNASTSQVVIGNDTRLSDARVPASHASTHASGGSDAISIVASQVSGIAAALASQNLDNVVRVGIGTTDTGNKLSVSGPSVLFSNTGDMRATISKGASANTASLNFQDNYSTRVQFGLLGNDDFTISVSADGSTFNTGLAVNHSSGSVSFPNTGGFTGDSGSGGASGLVPAPAAGTAAAGKFLKADGSWSVPPGTSQVNSDWNASSGVAQILNKPALAASATTDTTNASNISSGTLSVARGGTGAASLSAHGVLIGEGTGPIVTTAAMTAGQLLIGQGVAADPSPQTVGGDATLSNSGSLVVTKTNGSAFAPSATTDATNASNIASGTLAASRLPLFSSSAKGAVNASGGGTANFLRADGTWAAPPATGPGGSSGQLQYNNAGSFGGLAGTSWNSSTGVLTVSSLDTTGTAAIGGDSPLSVTAAANNPGLTISGYTSSGSDASQLVSLAGTWNTTGSPTGLKLNITNTASASTALLGDFQIGGTSIFSIEQTGHLRLKSGNYQFELCGRGAELSGLTYGVPYFRSTTANKPTALDIMPNGTASTYFTSWIDVCNSDLSGGSSNYQSVKIAVNSSVGTIGMDAGGTGTVLPLNVCGSTIAFNNQAQGTITQYGQIDQYGLKMGPSSGFWFWMYQTYTKLPAGYSFLWNSTSNIFGTLDTGLTRASAGLVQITNGSSGNGSLQVQDVYTSNASFALRSKATITSGAGTSTGTLTNAPSSGNPTKWLPYDDNGTTRYIPAW